jgi:Arm DNA-binding domain
MPLTDTSIRNAKPSARTTKLFDGGGLYLEVSPAGGKWWRLKYRFEQKEKRLSLGVYPEVSLKATPRVNCWLTALIRAKTVKR